MPSAQAAKLIKAIKRLKSRAESLANRIDRNCLGDDLLDIVVEGIRNDFTHQVSPDGTTWAALSREYAAWKATHFPGQPIGFLHDVMATDSEFQGYRLISPREAYWVFGVTAEAKEEAEWFEKRRPFIGVSSETMTRLEACLASHFQRIV